MKKTSLLFSILLLVFFGYAQKENYYYQTAVYDENIKSVQMYRDGFELSHPVIELGDEVPLFFQFDVLSENLKNYSYTLVHCDHLWNESFIHQADYLNGFPTNPLVDYGLSFNTTFDYINYQLVLPNENVQFKYSGNYVLVIFEDNDREKVVLTHRFYVVQSHVQIEGTVRRATLDAFQGANQEVDFTILHPNLPIQNPRNDVKVVLMQNGRWDNAIKDLKPLYIRDGELIYDYSRENVFPGGNEFRYFDNRTNRINGENVVATDFHRPYFHKTLVTDQIRSNKKFFKYEEMNGRYTVESQDPEKKNWDLECDYTFVHFTLPLENILLGGTVNVFGQLTGWNANKSNEMTWNFETSQYELTLLLKQGYYNYQYAYVEQGALSADLQNLEGSFWETENEYQIFVYYRDIAGRYDQLVGFRNLNSAIHYFNPNR